MSILQSTRTKTLFAAILGPLMVATACGTGTTSASYASVPQLPTPGTTMSTASGVTTADLDDWTLRNAGDPAPLPSVSQQMFDKVVTFYDAYLVTRAEIIEGSSELDEIDNYVTESGQLQVAEALAYNKSLHADERLSAVDQLWLYSNVESISQVDEQTILIRACDELQEINSLDQHWIYWLRNEVLIDVSSGQLRVADFTTTHNGFYEIEDPIGCAPVSFRERAEATAAQAWTELTEWSRSTDGRIDANLSETIGQPLRQRLIDAVPASGSLQADEAPEHASFSATGMDTAAALGAQGNDAMVIIVDSCHQFPEGRTGTDAVSQSVVAQFGAGDEQALRFRVLLDPSREDRVDQVISIDYRSDRCTP